MRVLVSNDDGVDAPGIHALAKGLRDADHEIKTQQELLDVKKGDAATIKAKYDADRKRYSELTGRSTATPAKAGTLPASGQPR